MQVIFQQNTTAFWKGADIVNHERAQLAVQNLQKRYCTKEVPTKFSDPGASTSTTTQETSPQEITGDNIISLNLNPEFPSGGTPESSL